MFFVSAEISLMLLMHMSTTNFQHVAIYLELAFLKITIASCILLVKILLPMIDKEIRHTV